jgi:hypothetical protein
LVCAGASADQPATRPAAGFYGNFQLRRAMRAFIGKTNGVRPATQEEWDDMMAFMQKYSPARASVLVSIPVAHDSQIALESIRKWRNYVFTSEHFPAIADDLRRRFQLEDDLFVLMEDSTNPGGEDELRDKIHDKVAEIVQLEINEHQVRIDRLEKLLSDEKNRLELEQSSVDDIVDRRTDMIFDRLERRTPNLSLPTTRPEESGAAEDVPPAAPHDALMNVANPTDPAAK